MKAKTIKKVLAVAMAAVGFAAFAAPAVTVNSVTESGTWSTIDVSYTLSGVDTSANYKMQFDVTVDGVTKTVTDDSFATKSNTSYTKTIDTKTLFGSACRDAKAKVKVSLLDDQPDLSGGQLWAGGPYWAGCNLGASKPEEYGYYFWWGDTVGYVYNSTDKTFVSSADGTTTIKFTSSGKANSVYGLGNKTKMRDAGWMDANNNLLIAHDAARAHLGGDWRMPSGDEVAALVANCDWKWATLNGVNGVIVTGRGDYAQKGMFLPAAGYGNNFSNSSRGSKGKYWSTTMTGSNYETYVTTIDFYDNQFIKSREYTIYWGLSIRPVR